MVEGVARRQKVQLIGDAMLLLSAAGRIQLLKFTDTATSKISEDERQRFAPLLEAGLDLGVCRTDECKKQGLLERMKQRT